MPTGARLRGGLLQIVPVLNDPALFEAKNVEADLRAEEIILCVGEDKVAILKDADRVDLRSRGQTLCKGSNAGRALAHVKVVLNVLGWIDMGKGAWGRPFREPSAIQQPVVCSRKTCFSPSGSRSDIKEGGAPGVVECNKPTAVFLFA
jgi:hypothetical protein